MRWGSFAGVWHKVPGSGGKVPVPWLAPSFAGGSGTGTATSHTSVPRHLVFFTSRFCNCYIYCIITLAASHPLRGPNSTPSRSCSSRILLDYPILTLLYTCYQEHTPSRTQNFLPTQYSRQCRLLCPIAFPLGPATVPIKTARVSAIHLEIGSILTVPMRERTGIVSPKVSVMVIVPIGAAPKRDDPSQAPREVIA